MLCLLSECLAGLGIHTVMLGSMVLGPPTSWWPSAAPQSFRAEVLHAVFWGSHFFGVFRVECIACSDAKFFPPSLPTSVVPGLELKALQGRCS